MDLNLDTLKREILEYLDASGFAVFHGSPGGLEGLPMVLWDVEQHPDYQMFLEVAQKSGVKLILFATREFETAEVDEIADAARRMRADPRRASRIRIAPARSARLRRRHLLARAGLRLRIAPVRLRSAAGLVRRVPGHRRGTDALARATTTSKKTILLAASSPRTELAMRRLPLACFPRSRGRGGAGRQPGHRRRGGQGACGAAGWADLAASPPVSPSFAGRPATIPWRCATCRWRSSASAAP